MTLCSPLYNIPVVKSDRFTVACVKLKGQSLIVFRTDLQFAGNFCSSFCSLMNL